MIFKKYCLRVVESWMIEIMTNASRNENAEIFLGQMFVQFTGMY